MVDRYGTPFTRRCNVIERYRLIDGAIGARSPAKARKQLFGRRTIEPFHESKREGDIDPDTTKAGIAGRITVDDPELHMPCQRS